MARAGQASTSLVLAALLWPQVVSHTGQELSSPNVVAERMLVRSYMLSKDLVPEERAILLTQLAHAATVSHPALARLWSEELFQLAFTLPMGQNRIASEKNALASLSSVDPERAMELFGTMDAPAGNQDAWAMEDARTSGAIVVFRNYWKLKGAAGLEAIRSAARHLGETGEYPYLAMTPIIRDLAKTDAAAAASVFAEAVTSYERRSRIRFALREHNFADLLEAVWEVVPRPLAAQGLRRLVSDLLEEPPEGADVYRGQVYTGAGAAAFDNPADALLLRLLPRMREVDPQWARRVVESRPQLGRAVQVGGSVQRQEAVVIRGGQPTPARVAELQQRAFQRRRLKYIESITGENPEEALRLSTTLSDAALRGAALAQVAIGFSGTSADRSRELMKNVTETIATLEDEPGKVKALVSLAEAYAAVNDLGGFRETAKEAFDLGVELFRQDLDVHPGKPAYTGAAMDDLVRLVRVATRFDTEHTLAQLETLQSQVLQAYLLMHAASALHDFKSSTEY